MIDNISFTVVIPLYNKGKYIQRTINSVLNQTHQNFEILVINDGSTDDSLKQIEKIKSEKIRILNQLNQGVSVARNTGIREAKYNWISLLDGDDEYKPSFLGDIKTAIEENENCIAYVTSLEKINLNGNSFIPKLRFVPKFKGILKNYYKSCFWGKQCITSSSICLNRGLLETNNLMELFPPLIKRGEDLDAWSKLALNNQIYFINKTLVKINSVIDNVSNIGFNYIESFNYKKWLGYKTNNFPKSFYLKGLVMKKKLHIAKKLFFLREFKSLVKYVLTFKTP